MPVVLSNAGPADVNSGRLNGSDIVDIFVVNIFSVSDITVSLVSNCDSSVVSVSCFVEALVLIDDDFVGSVFGKDLYVATVEDKTCVVGFN